MVVCTAVVQPRRAGERGSDDLEPASLSSWATLSRESKGREAAEPADPVRTAFQVDIDRIIACGSFRRLARKTHLPAVRPGQRARTRLDHTLAGVRASRVLARALRLNEDLAEAIALGRDLGAAAFGRAGEEAFSVFTPAPFRHEEQAVRVVQELEADGAGLNLTWEVRDGIATHAPDAASPATLEGQAVRLADRVVTATGDVATLLAAGVISGDDVPAAARRLLGGDVDRWAAVVLADVVEVSAETPEVGMSTHVQAALEALEETLGKAVQASPHLVHEHARALHCLRSLVVFLLDNPERLPALHRDGDAPLPVRVVDHVASFGDREAIARFEHLFLPRPPP